MNTISRIIKKHRRHVPAIALLLGLVWDFFLLRHPDSFFANVVLLGWLVTSLGTIFLLSIQKKRGKTDPLFILGLMQFAFGNLAGSLLVLYGRSGSLSGSILFFLVLGSFLIGNEFLKTRYARLQFHIAAWYLLLLAYLVLVVPLVVKETGTGIFILSGMVSLGIVGAFLYLLTLISREGLSKHLKQTIRIILVIFVSFNALYFLNIIPPVPLSIETVGVYHLVEKQPDGGYNVEYERPNIFNIFSNTSTVFHNLANGPAYCFSSIYAPIGISAPIYHRWEFYDPVLKRWETSLYIAFPIVGGRDTGYRGYSIKSALVPGKWRCSVETENGALIGRVTFTVVLEVSPRPLRTKVL